MNQVNYIGKIEENLYGVPLYYQYADSFKMNQFVLYLMQNQGELGTREEFVKAYGEAPLGSFIRGIVGLEINAAKEAFGEILQGQNLNSQQIRFMDTIINFFSVKGIIDPEMLFEPPFTDINTSGVMGVFDEEETRKVISIIEKVNATCMLGWMGYGK